MRLNGKPLPKIRGAVPVSYCSSKSQNRRAGVSFHTSILSVLDSTHENFTNNFHAPSKYVERGRNSVCELCQGIGKHGTFINCFHCNVVAHESCIRSVEPNARINIDEWVCRDCLESIDYNKRMFDSRNKTAIFERQCEKAQELVSKCFRRYKYMKLYQIKLAAVACIQRMFRVKRIKLVFRRLQKGTLRPIKVLVSSCSDLPGLHQTLKQEPCNPFVVVSVMDQCVEPSQSWYAETKHVTNTHSPIFNDTFHFSGVSGNQQLIFTVFHEAQMENVFNHGVTSEAQRHSSLYKAPVHHSTNVILGQVILPMSYQSVWRTGGSFTIHLEDEEILPMDSTNEFPFQFTRLGIYPKGSIHFTVTSFVGSTSAQCGYVDGSSIEEYSKVLRRGPRHRAITLTEYTFPKAEISFATISYYCNIICQTKVPPTRRLWICTTGDGILYVHKRFGSNCRIMFDVRPRPPPQLSKYSTLSGEIDLSFCYKSVATQFILSGCGLPPFAIIPLSHVDNFRWKMAFCSLFRNSVLPSPNTSDQHVGASPSLFNYTTCRKDVKKYCRNGYYMLCIHTNFRGSHVNSEQMARKNRRGGSVSVPNSPRSSIAAQEGNREEAEDEYEEDFEEEVGVDEDVVGGTGGDKRAVVHKKKDKGPQVVVKFRR